MKPFPCQSARRAARVLAAVAMFMPGVAGAGEPDYRVEPVPSDPLAGSPQTDPAATGENVETIFATLLPPRTDSPIDWLAGPEPLHRCTEPRALPPCVPPPPCHPSEPPSPFDLVGVGGTPSCGPINEGPCCPRTGSHGRGPRSWLHWLPDRLFDLFYKP